MPCVSLVVTTQAARSADQLSELKAIVPQWRAGFRSDPVRWKPARERVGRVSHLLRHLLSANPKTGPSRDLFLYVPKGFAGTIRPSEAALPREIGLRTPTVSFHPPLARGETGKKSPYISVDGRGRAAPVFRRFRLVSKQAETRHGRRGRWYVLGVLREVSDDKRSFRP